MKENRVSIFQYKLKVFRSWRLSLERRSNRKICFLPKLLKIDMPYHIVKNNWYALDYLQIDNLKMSFPHFTKKIANFPIGMTLPWHLSAIAQRCLGRRPCCKTPLGGNLSANIWKKFLILFKICTPWSIPIALLIIVRQVYYSYL